MPCTIPNALIPATDVGSRLLPVTESIPKALLPVGVKPVIEHTARTPQLRHGMGRCRFSGRAWPWCMWRIEARDRPEQQLATLAVRLEMAATYLRLVRG